MRIQRGRICLSKFLSLALPLLGCRYVGYVSPVRSVRQLQIRPVSNYFYQKSDADIRCSPPQNVDNPPKSWNICGRFDFISCFQCFTKSCTCKRNSDINLDYNAKVPGLKMEPNPEQISHAHDGPSGVSLTADTLASKGDESAGNIKPKHTKPEDTKPEDTKPKRTSPTHFVSVQISNPEILGALHDVQEVILKKEEGLEPALVAIESAHLTLMVIRLETEDEIHKAGLAMEKCLINLWSNYVQCCDVLELQVSCLGHFDQQVLFAKISPGQHLDQLFKIAESIESCLLEDGIKKADPRPFNPHLTLMKFTRDRARRMRKKGIKKIAPKLYQELSKKNFGVDVVKSVQLCSMEKPKDAETGYYYIEHEVLFGDPKKEDNGLPSSDQSMESSKPMSEESSSISLDDKGPKGQ